MKVTIFASAQAAAHIGIPRMIEAVRFRFGAAADIVLASETPVAGSAGVKEVIWKSGLGLAADVWVLALATIPIVEEPRDWSALELPGSDRERAGKKICVLEPHGLIHILEKDANGVFEARLGSKHEPYLNEHVFARLCPRGFRGSAYPFPYGGYYEALAAAFGPVNSFGFRFAEDFHAMERRDGDVFLAAVFGGSSTLSPACLQNETFSSRLAEMLNEYFSRKGGRFRTAHVLNFGNSGATVLNEMITYLLFAHRLSPQVIITHDIFNDFAHGLKTDPVLLAKHQITYLPEMENWAQILMGAQNIPLTQHGEAGKAFAVRSSPQAIVKAYIARKQQFMDIVERSGSEFIYGIQPAWFAKKPTPREQAKMQEIRRADQHNRPIFELMERLYGIALDHLRQAPPKHFVDVHAEFAKFGPRDELFVDHAHLNPAGDQNVARIYFDHIAQHNLPNLN